jgi:hypothetical protein
VSISKILAVRDLDLLIPLIGLQTINRFRKSNLLFKLICIFWY